MAVEDSKSLEDREREANIRKLNAETLYIEHKIDAEKVRLFFYGVSVMGAIISAIVGAAIAGANL